MEHQHIYDAEGKQLCCTQEEKIKSSKQTVGCCDHDEHEQTKAVQKEKGSSNLLSPVFKMFLPSLISLALLLTAIIFDSFLQTPWFANEIRIIWYVVAYIPVGIPVLIDAYKSILKKEIFSEFLLMCIATIGAFSIGEFPEAVAVMLFYSIGEVFQSLAVKRAKSNIQNLLDQRPDTVTIIQNNQSKTIQASEAKFGDIILLKVGDKLALDGELISENASFNTAALTGESKPDTKRKGETVLAGMINLNTVCEVKVTTAFEDSKLSKILDLVQNAVKQKAPTELFIRKFAKVYTPIVVLLATLICFTPYLFVQNYVFSEWLYRSLIFLVISCPCALVISIPLGYFGGIGAASKHGILFKGSNFLDILATIKHVVMDKTGTMTEGVFKVGEVIIFSQFDKEEILQMVNALENQSTHPIATAIYEYVGKVSPTIQFSHVEEIPGHGLKAIINSKEILVGNFKLMDKFKIQYGIDPSEIVNTVLAIAYDNKFVGYITIADKIKEDSERTIKQLKALNVKITMLSGDKTKVVESVAHKLGISTFFGDLLPEDKVHHVQNIKQNLETFAFVGDGVNDAPVIALSDVGIAMGGLGSDAAIETADVIIQDDKPSKIPMAINIGKQTKKIVWQNITLAFSVKALVLILGAGGLATMWEAVFADVGVALLAILNAVRIQRMKF